MVNQKKRKSVVKSRQWNKRLKLYIAEENNIEEEEPTVCIDEEGSLADDEFSDGDEEGNQEQDSLPILWNDLPTRDTFHAGMDYEREQDHDLPSQHDSCEDAVSNVEEEGYSSDCSNVSPIDTSIDEDPSSQFLEDEKLTEADLDLFLNPESEIDGPTELEGFLRGFTTSERYSGASTSRLLKGLKSLKKQKGIFDALPSDVRTLRKTPRNVIVKKVAEGTYYHFGIRNGITNYLSSTESLKNYTIKILVNMDGLPLFKSSREEFWPILALVRGQVTPFPIGVWSGVGKPSCSNSYLRDFVDEAKQLEEDGLVFNGREFTIKIWGFSCDAPARSFITGTKGHTAKNACPKCKTIGVYYKKPGKSRGRETFPDLDAELRTHKWFIDQAALDYGAYHSWSSILEELDIDMVMDIPLDYMHLV